MTIIVSVTLKEGGTWWMKNLASHQDLLTVLNTGFLEGNQLAAIAFNLEGQDTVYDFVLKAKGVEPFSTRISRLPACVRGNK